MQTKGGYYRRLKFLIRPDMVSREQWTDWTQCEEVEIVNGAETHWKIVTHYNSAETPGTRGGEIVKFIATKITGEISGYTLH